MTHDSPLCAQLGHYVSSVTMVYCPHQQAWLVVWSAGDEVDDMSLDHGRVDFGPFDSADDVARRVESLVSMLVRVRSRQWLAARHEPPATGVPED